MDKSKNLKKTSETPGYDTIKVDKDAKFKIDDVSILEYIVYDELKKTEKSDTEKSSKENP